MPLSTALPPPVVEVVARLTTPGQNVPAVGSPYAAQAATGSVGLTTGPGGGGGSSTELVATRGGRACVRYFFGSSGMSRSFRPSVGAMAYDAALFNPGALIAPSGVVAVYDIHLAAETANVGTDGDADRCGVWFLPADTGGGLFDQLAPSINTLGGFGMTFAPDGAGGTQFEYLSWGAGANNILERIVEPAGSVVSHTDWSTVRFQLISAAGGRPATLTVQLNAQDVLVARQFGSPELNGPLAFGATNMPSWNVGVSGVTSAVGGRAFFWALDATWGRFTPDGREIQGR